MSRNRLAGEKSPYLIQHADNPVDWYPWGEEAFEKARSEDKPIFLSIGYSTCHWCHVMENESFEDPEVALLMNEAFVCIKVDREERPDIDHIYMTICQMATGGGGWPLTIIMTPDKKPFFTATYLPKRGRYGRPGMIELIPQIRDHWQNRRDELSQVGEKITDALRESVIQAPGESIGEETLRMAYEQLSSRYDSTHGGFGGKPKFPTPHNLLFLLRSWKRTGEPLALEMVEHTLREMRWGGIYDHIGFGFHRYSTDERWFLPHFEKMLYDQAMLAMAYTEAFQATGKEAYRKTAEEIFTYVLRDMTDPMGGFYSAEDADSEGEEGKFYLWATKEVLSVLGEQDGELFIRTYGLEKEGNYRDEAGGAKTGRNLLHLNKPLVDVASEVGAGEKSVVERIERMREMLFAEREKRTHPYKDDKILTDWNGLMIAALAKAAIAFDEPRYGSSAARAVDFVLKKMRDGRGRLYHRFRDGEASITANVDDYAFLIWGLIELYEATFELRYLKAAIALSEDLLQHFWDKNNGGFYITPDDGEKLLVRAKEIYDGATPSGNSVAMLDLLRLGRMTAKPELEEMADRIGRAFQASVSHAAAAYTQLLAAVDFGIGPSYEVVIVGEPEADDTRALQKALNSIFLPNKVVLFRPSGEPSPEIAQIASFTGPQRTLDGKATVYVCKNYACELPTTEIGKMKELLGLEI
ncbi:MAG: DUF255 domain-containing protein [Candidatus Latescibacteria bacterium]|nr:DUF255 domain-containing protein [Candidatus Latescibacterota bacterium]NIM22160.1 DUF255 domain-containing protein [Candidatus Latescibacterota bacterium]NIM64710.1 DUF255 domain-containing protein [Candidatus Latescibacterota bacterium]NIO01220.1 DUF255 domain-containing protein [Candidatus Latescibacterota bacterium]NIO27605.1 DUF255 domain-containing protein [Candidatus Latescibacterota bacterium]